MWWRVVSGLEGLFGGQAGGEAAWGLSWTLPELVIGLRWPAAENFNGLIWDTQSGSWRGSSSAEWAARIVFWGFAWNMEDFTGNAYETRNERPFTRLGQEKFMKSPGKPTWSWYIWSEVHLDWVCNWAERCKLERRLPVDLLGLLWSVHVRESA